MPWPIYCLMFKNLRGMKENSLKKAPERGPVRSALKVWFSWDIDHSLSSVTKATRDAGGVGG